MSDVTDRVLAQYPSLIALLGHPEIGPLLVQAVDPNVGFSQQTFEARLHETQWWKTTPATAREALIQQTTDPASYQRALTGQYSSLGDWNQKMGVYMTPDEYTYIINNWQQQGIDVNSPQSQNELNVWLKSHPDRAMWGGAIYGAVQEAFTLAKGTWLVSPDWGQGVGWAIDLAMGKKTMSGLNQELAQQAMGKYPHLNARLQQGETVADIVNPYREVIARELELGDVGAVDINTPQWGFLTGMPDPANRGSFRLPTMSEVQTAARRDTRWWRTSGGRQADAGMTRTLLEAFGKVAA